MNIDRESIPLEPTPADRGAAVATVPRCRFGRTGFRPFSVRRGTTRLTSLWLMVVAAFIAIQSISLPLRATPQEESVNIELITGEARTLPLTEITRDGKLVAPGAAPEIELGQVLSITWSRSVQANETPSQIFLAQAGQISADQIVLDNEQLQFNSAVISGPLPLEAVRGIQWQSHERLTATLDSPLPDKDQVVVQSSDGVVVVAGLLESIDSEKLKMDYDGQSRTISRDKIVGVVFANLNANQTGERPSGASCQLINGDRVRGELLEMSVGQLKIRVESNTTLTVPVSSVQSIELISDRLLHLTDLSPTIQENRSWFAAPRPWQKNRSIRGQPLRLVLAARSPAVEFSRGFGLSSYSRLVFDVPPDFDRFQGYIGIDPETGDRGDCQALIAADGIRLWSGRLQGGQPAEKIDLDISQVKQLELIIDFGQNFDLADHVNVVNPRLLKTR